MRGAPPANTSGSIGASSARIASGTAAAAQAMQFADARAASAGSTAPIKGSATITGSAMSANVILGSYLSNFIEQPVSPIFPGGTHARAMRDKR
jgi:hypothetical protein